MVCVYYCNIVEFFFFCYMTYTMGFSVPKYFLFRILVWVLARTIAAAIGAAALNSHSLSMKWNYKTILKAAVS